MSTSTSEHRLILLRHAKADRPTGVPDPRRPLSQRGVIDAAAAGEWLAERPTRPDLVLCSPSERTRQTWHHVSLALDVTPTVRYVEEIYSGGPWELLELLRGVSPDMSEVLVVGHNPTVELFAALLDPAHGGRMKTAALSVHHQRLPWAELGARTAPVVEVHVARGGGDTT